MIRLYLDIDGVLLTKKLQVPEGAQSLIAFAVKHFDCYWLTTHCRHGANKSIPYLAQFYPTSTIELLKQVKANDWMDLKTEGIRKGSDFIWLEDAPFEAERRVLEEWNKTESLWTVDLGQPKALAAVLQQLQDLLTN